MGRDDDRVYFFPPSETAETCTSTIFVSRPAATAIESPQAMLELLLERYAESNEVVERQGPTVAVEPDSVVAARRSPRRSAPGAGRARPG